MRIWIVKRGSVSVTPICTRWLILRYSCGPACRDIVLAIVEPGRCSRKRRKRKKIYIKNTKNFECFPSPSRIEKYYNFSLSLLSWEKDRGSFERRNRGISSSSSPRSFTLDPRFRLYRREYYRNWPAWMYGPPMVSANNDTCWNTASTVITNRWHADK